MQKGGGGGGGNEFGNSAILLFIHTHCLPSTIGLVFNM
jgi:hypothetical protein